MAAEEDTRAGRMLGGQEGAVGGRQHEGLQWRWEEAGGRWGQEVEEARFQRRGLHWGRMWGLTG